MTTRTIISKTYDTFNECVIDQKFCSKRNSIIDRCENLTQYN